MKPSTKLLFDAFGLTAASLLYRTPLDALECCLVAANSLNRARVDQEYTVPAQPLEKGLIGVVRYNHETSRFQKQTKPLPKLGEYLAKKILTYLPEFEKEFGQLRALEAYSFAYRYLPRQNPLVDSPLHDLAMQRMEKQVGYIVHHSNRSKDEVPLEVFHRLNDVMGFSVPCSANEKRTFDLLEQTAQTASRIKPDDISYLKRVLEAVDTAEHSMLFLRSRYRNGDNPSTELRAFDNIKAWIDFRSSMFLPHNARVSPIRLRSSGRPSA